MLDLEFLSRLHDQFQDELSAQPESFEIRGQRFGHYPDDPALMGVVNLSSDSWYRESVSLTTESAIRRGKRLMADGARLIDLGAESTVLTAERVDADGQQAALLPVVNALAGEGALVSTETYSLEVAEACLEAGAAVLNLTAAANTAEFYKLAAAYKAGVVICYIQGNNPREVSDFDLATDHTSVLHDYFETEIERATSAGVERLWIDPGLGFYYKNLQDSSERIRYQMQTFVNAFRLRKLGWPVCQALPHAFEYFEDDVRCAEPFFAVLAMLGKVDLLRTHEVSRVRGVLRTLSQYSP
ncbi:MAG: dihydropteroate synthase [Verrucomicrobiota bacterium]